MNVTNVRFESAAKTLLEDAWPSLTIDAGRYIRDCGNIVTDIVTLLSIHGHTVEIRTHTKPTDMNTIRALGVEYETWSELSEMVPSLDVVRWGGDMAMIRNCGADVDLIIAVLDFTDCEYRLSRVDSYPTSSKTLAVDGVTPELLGELMTLCPSIITQQHPKYGTTYICDCADVMDVIIPELVQVGCEGYVHQYDWKPMM